MDQLLDVMTRIRRGLSGSQIVRYAKRRTWKGKSSIPSVASSITETLDTARTVGRVELEVVRVLDGNHVSGCAGCIRVITSENRSREVWCRDPVTYMRE